MRRMRKESREMREIGITQSLMFSGHEWRDEERRLHRNDRCKNDLGNAHSRPLDDTGFAGMDCADLLDPELVEEEYEPEPEPHLVIALEREMMEKDEIMARRHYRTWKFRFRPWF
jgi:hypothetical protein